MLGISEFGIQAWFLQIVCVTLSPTLYTGIGTMKGISLRESDNIQSTGKV